MRYIDFIFLQLAPNNRFLPQCTIVDANWIRGEGGFCPPADDDVCPQTLLYSVLVLYNCDIIIIVKINYSISDKPRKPHNTFLLATFLHHGQARLCLYNMFNQQRRGGPCTTAEARTCYLPVHTALYPPPPLLFLPNNTLRAFVFAAKTKAARSRETNQATFSCMVTVANAGLDGDL